MQNRSDWPAVDIVVLNFNGSAHLGTCLESILATDYPNYHVLVVDNNSSDRSWELAEQRDRVSLIRNNRNLGWSGGNNVGIRYGLERDARYIILANNDIAVHPAWVKQAVTTAEADPELGVIGFDVYDAGERSDAEAAFKAACQKWRPGPAIAVADVGGMAMFVRGTLFREIGLIDESFWAYGDENDFLRRTSLAGYRAGVVSVPVWHVGSASFGRVPLRAAVLQTENNIQLLLKYGRPADLVRGAALHVWRRCTPRRRRLTSAVEQRLSGQPFVVNAAVFLLASTRIALKFPRIMRNRRVDRRAALAVRLRRSQAGQGGCP